VIAVEHDLVKELVAVQEDGAAADLAAEDRDVVFPAIGHVDLLGQVLMVADTHIWLGGGQDVDALHAQARLCVVDELRVQPGDVPKVV
jgi:hypothetical protein